MKSRLGKARSTLTVHELQPHLRPLHVCRDSLVSVGPALHSILINDEFNYYYNSLQQTQLNG